MVHSYSLFTDLDIHLFREGKHFELYKKMGCHAVTCKKKEGLYFAVWAPSAGNVSVIGDFNGWNPHSHSLHVRWDSSGIWEGFIAGLKPGTTYKYSIQTASGKRFERGDPFARQWEEPPRTASVAYWDTFNWNDQNWMREERKISNRLNRPLSIYEVHMGSWRRNTLEGNRSLTYREMAIELVQYLNDLAFTHVEFMPVMEHPFYGSWGYQIHGYFAPTSRYGSPEDFKYLIDALHKAGIGVILDWVPSHFPGDEHGLFRFDGSALYEHEDPRQGFHPDWKSYIFNYGRNEVKSFLISNAMYWCEEFHIDGLRVDAVASMLYLDYSREDGEWIPNAYGGRENLEAIAFIQEFNTQIHQAFPEVLTIAEESTAFSGVSRPVESGGLGFDLKWMMGWMNDTLEYFKRDPIHRKYHHNEISFSMTYAFSEKYVLPLSHDEVVHGKGAIIDRMPGDEWQRFAQMRLLYGYMYAHPGAKLLFMGNEFGQTSEWKHDSSLFWHYLDYLVHSGLQRLVRDLNRWYYHETALFEYNYGPDGFEWIDYSDGERSILSFVRKGLASDNQIVVICNFTPAVHHHYALGVPFEGEWKEVFNSDQEIYGGSGVTNTIKKSNSQPINQFSHHIKITVPPLGFCAFKHIA
jgi:1,4-alpha-glucan branching enzyme